MRDGRHAPLARDRLTSNLPVGERLIFSTGKDSPAFNFRRRSNGIVVAFSEQEWRALGELMDRALALPEMQLVLAEELPPHPPRPAGLERFQPAVYRIWVAPVREFAAMLQRDHSSAGSARATGPRAR